MKLFLTKRGLWFRYGAAALGGVVCSLAFPNAGVAGFAWIAPAIMLFSALGAGGKTAFFCGLIAGAAEFLVSLSWLLNIPYTFLGLPLAPGLGWLALSLYCALYTGAWVWFCWRIFPLHAAVSPLAPSAAADHFVNASAFGRLVWALECAAAWTGLEVFRACFLTGFPWNLLGNSQFRMLPIIQIAAFTGVYGVSFLIVWMSISLGALALHLWRRPSSRETIWATAGLPLLAVVAVVAMGASQVAVLSASPRTLKVALVQPSFPQTVIWDENADAARFDKIMAFTRQALASDPDLLLWPESGAPEEMTEEDDDVLAHSLSQHHTWMVLCLDSSAVQPNGATNIYNSAFLLNPAGRPEGIYHKRRLVMFGEYIPLIHWLPFLQFLAPVGEGFSPGREPVQFHLTQPAAQVSVLICFEDVFPTEARQHVDAATDFLINLTNDGWFGDGSAQWQQTASAVFRAVENGLPLVRCSNNGITCWIDARGRLRQVLGRGSSCYAAGVMTAQIPLDAAQRHETWYHHYGDVFPWGCFGLAAAVLSLTEWRRKHLPVSLSDKI